MEVCVTKGDEFNVMEEEEEEEEGRDGGEGYSDIESRLLTRFRSFLEGTSRDGDRTENSAEGEGLRCGRSLISVLRFRR